VAEEVSCEVLCIPMHPQLSSGDLEAIISAVRGALDAD
jgi:dTDP-4-amino-4,6-dideoxygalactose transaminase